MICIMSGIFHFIRKWKKAFIMICIMSGIFHFIRLLRWWVSESVSERGSKWVSSMTIAERRSDSSVFLVLLQILPCFSIGGKNLLPPPPGGEWPEYKSLGGWIKWCTSWSVIISWMYCNVYYFQIRRFDCKKFI